MPPKKPNQVNIKPEQLNRLMETRGKEAIKMLDNEFGGSLGLCRQLGVSPTQGLDGDQADIALRQQLFGKNQLDFHKSKTFWQLVLQALQDKTLLMLEISAIISLALSFYKPPNEETEDDDLLPLDELRTSEVEYIESIAMFASILIIVLVSTLNDYNKEKQFRGLQKRLEKEQRVSVIRNGRIVDRSVSELVVGDIIIVKYGDVIPVDGILLDYNVLKIDESSLTGESKLVTKGLDTDVILYSGCFVMEGDGRLLITAVGTNSQAGVIFSLMKSAEAGNDKSVLQSKLADLAVKIGYFGISIAIFTTLMLITQFLIQHMIMGKHHFGPYYVKYLFRFVIVGITILVVAVPEGLPLAVTLALAYSVRQMMKDNNLVRHLDACETMGNATTICSDKTGTLTANRMTSDQCFVCGVYYKTLSKRTLVLPPLVVTLLSQNISLNSAPTSQLVKDEHNQIKQFGNQTECALLGFLYRINCDYQTIRNGFPGQDLRKQYPFNSTIKLMRSIIALPDKRGFRLLAKGASELIVKKCTYLIGPKHDILSMPPEEKEKITNKIIKPMAQNGLRTICLAYRDYVFERAAGANETIIQTEPNWDEEETYTNMTLIAVVGIEDRVRRDVPKAIKTCQKAGITVRMVTGDNIDTAKAIALKCNIVNGTNVNEKHVVLESRTFNELIRNKQGVVDQRRFDRIWPNLRVLARSSPNDKYTLVKHIIASKDSTIREVVAVTGDGTNDAPALKIADVGFAMGIAATEVAKQASDIILTDDNFSSIVKSVIWGRNVYDSISKFLHFQLTVNIVAVLICFIGTCAIRESPLKAVQMLWVNLIMDTLGSLALSTERPTRVLLLRKPYGRTKPLISCNMLKIIIAHVVYQLTVILTLVFHAPALFNIDSGGNSHASVHFTLVFNVFVFMTLFNEINARKINGERNVFQGLCSNWIFCAIFIITSILQVMIVQFGGITFSTKPLTCTLWIWCITIGLSNLLWGQIVTALIFKTDKYNWKDGLGHVFEDDASRMNRKLSLSVAPT